MPNLLFFLLNLFLTKVQKQYNGQRAAFSTKGAGDFGHAKKKKEEESWTNPQVKKLTQK